MLEIKNLSVQVEGKEILSDVSLEVSVGEVVALMGPNGSGKSSLSNTVIGNPKYEVTGGEVKWKGKDLLAMSVDERARQGIIMGFQQPMSIPGVTVRELLLTALRQRGRTVSALDMKKRIEGEADKLGLDLGLLSRGVNDGFSGGEKKKMEILQVKILDPELLILDEIDSGLDIDALKIIAQSVMKDVQEKKMGVLVITHYQRLLKYLKPSKVMVLKKGSVAEVGGAEIVEKLENKGYQSYE